MFTKSIIVSIMLFSQVLAQGGGGKDQTIVLGGGMGGFGGMGGLVLTENSIVAPGMGMGMMGMMPLVISNYKKSRNIVWGRRKRRDIAYVLPQSVSPPLFIAP
jgi:hypothetical protein